MRDLKVMGGSAETTSPTSAVVIKTTTNVWKSPIPYLFGSLAIMLLLISLALLLLICSYRKRYSSSVDENDENKSSTNHNKNVNGEDEDDGPKIVVIMAGDEAPTYLATPSLLAVLPPCTCSSADRDGDDDDHDHDQAPQSHV
ncbi:protein GLUTAMINE DUMPER 6 [Cannabis sativa]|uniref:protein GLUTAMINE DUMPER 6 n=1 Tax=Cannabis sativa TaxID=3483 RepID=UPI0029C9BC31|nr:protein GLUTAMINE DUMPER 6 [Cannabis sativa]